MSTTDSDNSIDWLASDNESEVESDCITHTPSPTSSPPHLSPSDGGGQLRGGNWSTICGVSSQGSPERVDKWSRGNATGLCKTQQGEKMNVKSPQQALKRPHNSTGDECRERQLSSSEKDRLFSRKCLELQCYIHPLSLILSGLRSGRYRERLSSFQESVAMDRIQRIMGVLQNPYMGEKYIGIILKMEEMLKSWFPNVKLQNKTSVPQTEESVPSKKAKLTTPPPTVGDLPTGAKSMRVTDLTPPGSYSANNLKWFHTSPICSPMAEQAPAGPRPLLAPRDRDVTQDNAVSSSTDTDSHVNTHPVPRGPPPGKINAPCLERLLKSTDSIITRKGTGSLMDNSWS